MSLYLLVKKKTYKQRCTQNNLFWEKIKMAKQQPFW